MEAKIDVTQDGIRDLRRASDRALLALAYLATGERTPCPKLVWIVPKKRIRWLGIKGTKDRFKDAFYQEAAVYFLCENTYLKGHKDPIIINVGREWVKNLLPLVKLSLLTLKMAGAVTSLPFPIPGLNQLKQFQYMEDLIDGVLKQEDSSIMRETLEDMEAWFRDTVEKGESILMEGDRLARIKTLTEGSYEMLSQQALQGKNMPKWQYGITSQIVFEDDPTGKKCQIKWVKV
jgi:hypothetical protein